MFLHPRKVFETREKGCVLVRPGHYEELECVQNKYFVFLSHTSTTYCKIAVLHVCSAKSTDIYTAMFTAKYEI